VASSGVYKEQRLSVPLGNASEETALSPSKTEESLCLSLTPQLPTSSPWPRGS
jgi:hypothetical protein